MKEIIWTCPICNNEFTAMELNEDWKVRGFCDCVENKEG